MENFNDIKKRITEEIDRYFDYAEKEKLFIEINPSVEDIDYIKCQSFLIAIHILIANKIHWFLNLSLDHKQDLNENDLKKIFFAKSEDIKLKDLKSFINDEDIYKIRKSPTGENIKKFIQFFNSNYSFSRYDESDERQPYTSLDAFDRIYKSRCIYAHEQKSGNALDYKDLKKYKVALYNFMDDVIKNLDLPID